MEYRKADGEFGCQSNILALNVSKVNEVVVDPRRGEGGGQAGKLNPILTNRGDQHLGIPILENAV